MKVTRKPFLQEHVIERIDVWNGIFQTGAEVVEGLYNDRCDNNPLYHHINNPKENGIYLYKGSALHVFRSKYQYLNIYIKT